MCPAGFYCEGAQQQPCPAGRYSEDLGTVSAAACLACPVGTYSAATAATSAATCALCGPFANSTAGSVACWPSVMSVTAFNPLPVTPGFSDGDVVVVKFSSPTNASAIVVFSPAIGTTSSSWRPGNQELWVTVISVAGVNATAVDVATGSLFVSVSGVFSADGASSPSVVVNRTVGGTWGIPAPPVIVGITVADAGRNTGPGTGDTLVVTFDQAVRQVIDVRSPVLLGTLLSFQPPFPIGVAITGAWTSPLSLTLSLTVAGGVLSNWTLWNVGVLEVGVGLTANLTSANGESGASNSSAVVRGGSWGDAPSLGVSSKNATAVVVTLALPTTSVGYTVNSFVVQWSTSASFTGSSDVPNSLAGVQAWLQLGAPSVPAVDSSNRGVASVVLLPSGPGSATDAAVVILTVPAKSLRPPLRFDIPRLTTSIPYFFRASCNGPAGAMGPAVPSDPLSVTTQLPRIMLVVAPRGGLPTAGGVVVEAEGEQLGAIDSTVLMVLSSVNFGSFPATDCSIVTSGSRVRCTSPPGVGAGLAVTLVVDGVASPPFANGTLSYSSPAITGLLVLVASQDSDVSSGGSVPTTGGGLVVVQGLNFGPAALGALSLGAVTFSPVALSVSLGTQVTFAAVNCAITRNHTEVTCGMGPGVGGSLRWSITIAGQSSSSAMTTYRPPVIAAVEVVTESGAVSSDPAALQALATSGGQLLVRLPLCLCA